MNWLDAMAMVGRVRRLWESIAHLKAGQVLPFVMRTKIAGRMWKFSGTAGPEE